MDGNHRFDAASQQLQERVVAWLVDMPLNKIRKYGNAEANRQKNSSKPRSNLSKSVLPSNISKSIAIILPMFIQ